MAGSTAPSPTPPAWKQLFDAAERTIGARINEFARSENYAILVGLAARAQRQAAERSERASRQWLHLANLPAGSDVNRLLAQIAKLEREVREMRKQLDDATGTPPVRLAASASARSAPTQRKKVAANAVSRQPRKRARQDSA